MRYASVHNTHFWVFSLSLGNDIWIMPQSIEDKIKHKVLEINSIADFLPTSVVIHRFLGDRTQIEYMSQRGLKELNLDLDQLKKMGSEYFKLFLNEHDAQDYIPKMLDMVARNDENEVFTFFQQARSSASGDWVWYLSSIKILMRDDEGKPLLLIITASPIDPTHHLTHKVSRLLVENNFLRENSIKFSSLTEREKEILKHIALGKSNKEIADEQSISVNTVETHRKNIKSKLDLKSTYELTQYASAFNLI